MNDENKPYTIFTDCCPICGYNEVRVYPKGNIVKCLKCGCKWEL